MNATETTATTFVADADFVAFRKRTLTNNRVIVASSPVSHRDSATGLVRTGYQVTTRKA